MNPEMQRVLDWINQFRKKFGIDPVDHLVRGEPVDMDHCTITNTIRFQNDEVFDVETVPTNDETGTLIPYRGSQYQWGYLAYYDGERHEIPLPKYVAQFAADFDQGKYPELIG